MESATDLVRCDVPADWLNAFSQCLYEWQGIEGAVLALFAAGASIWFLQKQIKQAQHHRADELARKHNAARLTLPLTLSSISDLVQNIANEVADEFEKFGPDGFSKTFDAILEDGEVRTRFPAVTVPTEILVSFQGFVSSLTHAKDIRHAAELIGSIQILIARHNSFDINQAGASSNLIGLLLDCAKVKFLNERIFNYARFVDDSSFGVVDVIPVAEAWNSIHGAAQGLVFSRPSPDIFFPDLQQRVQSYKDHNVSPWIEKFSA